MVQIFKTSVKFKNQAKIVIQKVKKFEGVIKCNFDLSDCDKILRIEGDIIDSDKIIELLIILGFDCEILEG